MKLSAAMKNVERFAEQRDRRGRLVHPRFVALVEVAMETARHRGYVATRQLIRRVAHHFSNIPSEVRARAPLESLIGALEMAFIEHEKAMRSLGWQSPRQKRRAKRDEQRHNRRGRV